MKTKLLIMVFSIFSFKAFAIAGQVETKKVVLTSLESANYYCEIGGQGPYGQIVEPSIYLTIENPFQTDDKTLSLNAVFTDGLNCSNIAKTLKEALPLTIVLTRDPEIFLQANNYPGSGPGPSPRRPSCDTEEISLISAQFDHQFDAPYNWLNQTIKTKSERLVSSGPLSQCTHSFNGIVDSVANNLAQCTGYWITNNLYPGAPTTAWVANQCSFSSSPPAPQPNRPYGETYMFTVKSTSNQSTTCKGDDLSSLFCFVSN